MLATFIPPLDLGNAFLKLNELLRTSSEYDLTLHLPHGGVKLDVVPGTNEVGLLIPIEVRLSSGASGHVCVCANTDGVGTLPENGCQTVCEELNGSFPVGSCSLVGMVVSVTKVPLWIALIPKHPLPPYRLPWTDNFSPGLPGLHQDEMFEVQVLIPHTMTAGVDVVVDAQVADCNVAAEIACGISTVTVDTCSNRVANDVAKKIAQKVGTPFSEQLQQQVGPLLSYHGAGFYPVAPLAPCDLLDDECSALVETDYLPASMTYQVYSWFMSPFQGMGPNGDGFVRITGITSDSTEKALTFEYDMDDPERDGVGLGRDNCPYAYNPGQENCNLDAELELGLTPLGDACDPTPCSNAESDSEKLVASFAPPQCRGNLGGLTAIGNEPCRITVDTKIRWQGLVAGPDSGTRGETKLAHCVCPDAHGTAEERVGNCQGTAADPRCVIADARAFPDGSATTPSWWGAITTTYPLTSGGLGVGWLQGTSTDVSYATTYQEEGAPVRSTSWRFGKDLSTFNVNLQSLGLTAPLDVEGLKVIASQLDGMGWAATRSFGGASLEGQPADLANNYFAQDLNPNADWGDLFVPPPLLYPACFVGDCNVLPEWPPMYSFPDPREARVIREGVVQRLAVIDQGLGRFLTQLGQSLELVVPSESPATLAVAGVALRGVALDVATQAVAGTLVRGRDGMERGTAPPVFAGPGRNARAFSALRGELYSVGWSEELGSQVLTTLEVLSGRVSQRPLRGIDASGRELALAYRLKDDSLYLIDELGSAEGASLRLLRISALGDAQELGRAPRGALGERLFLSPNPESQLVLSSSGSRGKSHSEYLLLDVRGPSARVVGWQRDAEPGSLSRAPGTQSRMAYAVVREQAAKGRARARYTTGYLERSAFAAPSPELAALFQEAP